MLATRGTTGLSILNSVYLEGRRTRIRVQNIDILYWLVSEVVSYLCESARFTFRLKQAEARDTYLQHLVTLIVLFVPSGQCRWGGEPGRRFGASFYVSGAASRQIGPNSLSSVSSHL